MGVFTCSLKHQRLSPRLLFYVHRCLSLSSRFSRNSLSPLHSLPPPPPPPPHSRFPHLPSHPSNFLLRYHSRFPHVRLVSTHFNPGDAGAADNNDNHLACSVVAPLADCTAEDNTTDEPSTSSPSSHRCQVDKNVDSAFQSLRTKFTEAFQKRVVDWQDIPGFLESFPYYLRYCFLYCHSWVFSILKLIIAFWFVFCWKLGFLELQELNQTVRML